MIEKGLKVQVQIHTVIALTSVEEVDEQSSATSHKHEAGGSKTQTKYFHLASALPRSLGISRIIRCILSLVTKAIQWLNTTNILNTTQKPKTEVLNASHAQAVGKYARDVNWTCGGPRG